MLGLGFQEAHSQETCLIYFEEQIADTIAIQAKRRLHILITEHYIL